jgi:hypothetical protein
VDIITAPGEDFEAMVTYMAHNDKGNFIGALMHQFKFDIIIGDSTINCALKYGQEGFFIKAYYYSNKLGQIVISRDYQKICDFLGLDYVTDKNGFSTLEDIFDFISKSKYFSWELFQLVNLNKINRERNVKRKSYMTFLEYIERFKGTDKENRFIYDKEYIMSKLMIEFPEFDNVKCELEKKLIGIKEKELVSEKFNGNIIMDTFGLQGKALGEAIIKFKNNITYDFNKYVMNTDKETILNDFKKIINVP